MAADVMREADECGAGMRGERVRRVARRGVVGVGYLGMRGSRMGLEAGQEVVEGAVVEGVGEGEGWGDGMVGVGGACGGRGGRCGGAVWARLAGGGLSRGGEGLR